MTTNITVWLNKNPHCLTLLMVLLDQLCDQTSPTRLVTSADSGAFVAVEIFVEWDQIAPMRVVLELFRAAENRPSLICILQEDVHQPPRNFPGYLPERHHLAGTGGTFHLETVSKIVVKLLK